MPSKAISVCKGKGSMNHNNRKFITKNVDEERMKDNIYYIQEPLQEAYDKCFGKAIEEYNANQKRADRRIDGPAGYMDKIRNSKNGEKLYYELVVQVGNMKDTNVRSEDGQIAKEILDKYMKSFQERNPNIYVFNAVLHMDEQTPHLHIDYIPLAKNYKKGLSVRNSLDKALKEQGIEPIKGGESNRFNNRTISWHEIEKEHIEEIMKEFDLQKAEKLPLKREHKSVEEYKMKIHEIEKEMNALDIDEISKTPHRFDKTKVSVDVNELLKLEKKATLQNLYNETYAEIINHAEFQREKARELVAQATEKELNAEDLLVQAEIIKAEAEKIIKEKDSLISYHASNSARYSSEAIHFKKMYEQEKENHNQTKIQYNSVVRKHNNLLAAARKDKENYEQQIENLTTKYESKIKSLQNKLNEAYMSLKTVVQATISLIRPNSLYKANLTEKQHDLVRGIEEYTSHLFKSKGLDDMSKEIQKERVAPDLEKFMPELQKQRERELALERQRKKVKSKSHGMEH